MAHPIGDAILFECRQGCASDAACPGQTCDAVSGRCVDVAIDAGTATTVDGG